MEELKILEFISPCCGYGSNYYKGLGRGDGSGSGTGYSSGYGRGSGIGCGNDFYFSSHHYGGSGSKFSHSYSDCSWNFYNESLISINGKKIYMVDGIATTIGHIHGNTAKGTIVNNDLTETPCYIVKEGKYFAHGETLAEANAALQDKLFDEMPTED